MPTYISLVHWTDQGAKSASDTVARAAAAGDLARSYGGSMQFHWTMGRYDLIAVSEFPDDAAVAACLAKIASGGNVRTETMRAFSAEEVTAILGK